MHSNQEVDTFEKMQFSCYHYHSNRCAIIIAFVKHKDIMRITMYFQFELGSESCEYSFVLNVELLKSYEILYNCYIMSLFLTKDIYTLIQYRGEWGIYNKKIWKGFRITEYHDVSFTFDILPTTIIIPENNDTEISKSISMLEKYNTMTPDSLSVLIDKQINILEKELDVVEKNIKMARKYELFTRKVLPSAFSYDLVLLVCKHVV